MWLKLYAGKNLILAVEACNHMSVSSVCKLRTCCCTLFCRIFTTRTEWTAARHAKRRRNISLKHDSLAVSGSLRIRDRNR